MDNFIMLSDKLEVEAMAGAHIYGCNKEAQELANKLGIPVVFKFNGEKYAINPSYRRS